MPTAVLVDGDFFIKRYRYLRGSQPPEKAAADLHWMCREHLKDRNSTHRRKLYRIFYYDCPPLTKTVLNPVTKRAYQLAKTPTANWRFAFHEQLKKLRKVALRLGYLNERMGHWIIKPEVLKLLFRGTKALSELSESDVRYEVKQMGVDMRIGLDIASMSYKCQVDQIVLVAGDSDFVPAAKLARREGIDFVLDPMWAAIRPDLHEHIDGLRSVFPRHKIPPAMDESNLGSATSLQEPTIPPPLDSA